MALPFTGSIRKKDQWFYFSGVVNLSLADAPIHPGALDPFLSSLLVVLEIILDEILLEFLLQFVNRHVFTY